MAPVIGTDSGFVTSAPSSDPSGTVALINFGGSAVRNITNDTSPSGSNSITEVGWYCQNATAACNYRIILYDSDGATVPGEAGTLLFQTGDEAKGTDAGWKTVAVDWSLSASHSYWLCIVFITTPASGNTFTYFENPTGSGGTGRDATVGTGVTDPFNGGILDDANGMVTVYALTEAGAAGTNMQINVSDSWKESPSIKINISDSWKEVVSMKINILDSWKEVF